MDSNYRRRRSLIVHPRGHMRILRPMSNPPDYQGPRLPGTHGMAGGARRIVPLGMGAGGRRGGGAGADVASALAGTFSPQEAPSMIQPQFQGPTPGMPPFTPNDLPPSIMGPGPGPAINPNQLPASITGPGPAPPNPGGVPVDGGINPLLLALMLQRGLRL